MLMLRRLAVAIAVGLLAALSLGPAPASASLEADLGLRQELIVPSQIDVNTGVGMQVAIFFRNLGPSQELAPALFIYTLTGPADCVPFSHSFQTAISFGSEPGLFEVVPLFCSQTGVKTFVSRAEIQPGTDVIDPNPADNVSILTFDVLVVSGELAAKPSIDLDGLTFTAGLGAAAGSFTIANVSTESGNVALESVKAAVSASPGKGKFSPISSTTAFTPTLAAGTVLPADSVTNVSFSSSYLAPLDTREIRVQIEVKVANRAETLSLIEGFLLADPD